MLKCMLFAHSNYVPLVISLKFSWKSLVFCLTIVTSLSCQSHTGVLSEFTVDVYKVFSYIQYAVMYALSVECPTINGVSRSREAGKRRLRKTVCT